MIITNGKAMKFVLEKGKNKSEKRKKNEEKMREKEKKEFDPKACTRSN